MLDPLTALSLASSVVQFVDFSTKLISDGVELYKKGSLSNNDELEQATRDLTNLTGDLISPLRPARSGLERLPKEELVLEKLAKSCKELGTQLISMLEGLQVQERQNGLESFRKAIRTSRQKGKIQDLETRLKKLQDQLGTHLLFLLSDQHSRVFSRLKDISDGILESEMNTSLKIDQLRNEIVAAISAHSENQKNKRDGKGRKEVKDQPILQEPLHEVRQLCQNLVEESSRNAASLTVMNSLFFKSFKVRHTDIKEAHTQTFEWIFEDSTNSEHVSTGFKNWLEVGDGIFWVAGKAGSGKSTLMKYLCDHNITRSSLEKWAGEDELIIASHYFWSAGTTMQRSQEGLLQSLLYQILRQCPQLIPRVCPSRWNSAINSETEDSWALQELSTAFSNLGNESRLSTKFFFFVDGLDEYEGEHIDVIDLLQRFVSSSNFKICLSSRPWNVFVEAFGRYNGKKLFLQDFTRGDITLYVKNKLEEDPRFLVLMQRDNQHKGLIEEIVQKAQGVFLWVHLVVRSLLRGLIDDNDISTLRLRLNHLPADLEEYFERILNNIEDVYQNQTAQIFQVMVHTISPLPTVAFHYLEMEKKDPNYAFNIKIRQPFDENEVIKISEKVRKHLNACCKDLIEVHHDINPKGCFDIYQYRVEFLHRTVRDFLKTKDMHESLQKRSSSGFNASVSLCRIFLALGKVYLSNPVTFQSSGEDEIEPLPNLLFHAKEVQILGNQSEVIILDDIYRVILEYGSSIFIGEFVEYLTKAGLHQFISHKLDETPRGISKTSLEILLLIALEGGSFRRCIAWPMKDSNQPFGILIDVDMVRNLLERGANPNKALKSTARWTNLDGVVIWQYFLAYCFENRDLYHHSPPTQIFQVAKLFIHHGADPDLKFISKRGGEILRPLLVFKAILRPAQYEQVSTLIAQKRAGRGLARFWKRGTPNKPANLA